MSIISGAVGGIAVASLKSAIDFETAFTGVTKTVDGTEEQLANLKQGILDMSTQLPSSASEIANVAEAAGQLGIQTDNILDFSKAMIDLGNSTNLTSDEAASQLAKFANIMQMSQKDFNKLGSSIVDLGNHFATTEADIVSMAMRLAGAGKQVGLSEGEVLGLATALSSVGIEAEMGGSAISKAMVKMQNAVEQGGTKLNDVLKKTGLTLRELELMSANDSKGFKELSQSIGMTSTEVKQLITAGTNLEDFAKVSGMTTEQFKKAWKEDAAGALSEFIKGLGDAENKGESAITMLSEMGLTEVRLRDSLLRAANAGTLFNDAIATGNKAWKENTALTTEANKRYGTTESQMKMLKNEVQKTAIEFGEELAPSLRKIVSDAKPILKSISSAVKAFSELNDEQKQTILKTGAFVVALGPLVKMLGTVTKTVGSTAKGIGTATKAIGLMKNGIGDATGASADLAKGLQKFGVTGVVTTGLVAGLVIAKNAINDMTQETRKYKEETKKSAEQTLEEKDAINELRNTIDLNMQSRLTEIEDTKTLWTELQKITDENGKIKEGYETRAEVITEKLSNALGEEITITNNVIDKYKELQSEIDTLILKKQGEAILSGYEEKYNNAITDRTQKTQELLDKQEELRKAKEKETELYNIHNSEDWKWGWEAKRDYKNWKNQVEAVQNLESEVNNLQGIVEDYTTDIANYNYNLELYSEGTTDSLNKMISETGKTYQRNGETVKTTFERQIAEQQLYIKNAKKLYEEAEKTHDESEKRKSQSTIYESNNRIQAISDELKKMTSIEGENSEDVVNAWKKLANDSYNVYFDIVSDYPEELREVIQNMTGVVLEEKPELIQETQLMSQNILDAINKSPEFKQVALSNLKSYLQGLQDNELRSLLENSGIENVDRVLQGIRKGNLGENEGMQILNSLNTGLENKSWKDKLFQTARGIASSLSNLLSVNAKITTTTSTNGSTGHADGLAYVPYNNYPARLHEGERVLTKEQNKKYMADNLQNKITTRNIVVQFYPQTMSEAEMQRAERYISRKWGAAL